MWPGTMREARAVLGRALSDAGAECAQEGREDAARMVNAEARRTWLKGCEPEEEMDPPDDGSDFIDDEES